MLIDDAVKEYINESKNITKLQCYMGNRSYKFKAPIKNSSNIKECIRSVMSKWYSY